MYLNAGRDSTVSCTVTVCGLDDGQFECWQGREFPLLHVIQSDSRAHSLLYKGYDE
jgi:hypothetical protein